MATVRSKLSDSQLFRAHLSAKRLKEMVASAKAISDTLVFQFDSGNDERIMRYWAIDDAQTCAMVGLVNNSMFKACEGDDVPHTIQGPTKHFMQAVSAFDMKRDIEVKLSTENNEYILILSQSKDDTSDPDVRKITVKPSDIKPKTPVIPKSAKASVNLDRLKKVLGGLKQNTDVVTVAIRTDELEISASTKRVQDGWTHATMATGMAKGLFAADMLKKAAAGAAEADSYGEIYLTEDYPLRIEAVSEDLIAQFYVAGRDVMK